MAYSFYMDSVQLPIAPSKLQIKISNNNKTITLINEGEVNLLKKAGLTEVSLSIIIPQVKYPFAIYPDGFQEAAYYLDKFEKLKTSLKPFQFIVSRVSPGGVLLFDTNLKVTLEDYSITEDANNGSDITVALNLKQYRVYGTKIVTLKKDTDLKTTALTTTKGREVTKQAVKSHIVVSGDTLWAICKKSLGDGSKYTQIAKLNGIKNPNLISVGQVIKFE
ncbi:LysM peptidoglycan-binding domain-containing protein [Paenibacillus sp. FA6]|uniref:LysM peptidoglycan-binding domain-containing protein n=1 Tax=Paenibacillus sp. FA6 TaxID=3413029 RepID=UPI003F657AD5